MVFQKSIISSYRGGEVPMKQIATDTAIKKPATKSRKISKNDLRNNVAGYLFIAPMLIGSAVLILFPIIASFFLSLTDWNFVTGLGGAKFVGLDNFAGLFQDSVFMKGLMNNFLLLLVVPVGLALSLILAVVINKGIYFKDTFKVIYFMPYISSTVAIALVFQVLFHPTAGPINQVLKFLGVENVPGWIASTDWSLISVMIIIVWTQIGFQIIMYIAALQNISAQLYERSEERRVGK